MMKHTIVAFGEIMLRLTPPDTVLNAAHFDAFYGGSESNVLVALSAMGNPTRYLTKLPQNDLGRGAVMHLNKYGVDCSQVIMQGDTMGMYFFAPGFACRQASVIYARKHSEVTTLTGEDLDFDNAFADCGLFHISGISFALSQSVEQLCFRLIAEAKKRQIPVSFDFNYRSKLWSVETAKKVFQQIVPLADIVFCSQRDLESFLDVTAATYFDAFSTPCLVVRERDIFAQDAHAIRASVYVDGKPVATVQKDIYVLERIGGGDAFAAGFLHGYLHFNQNWAKTLDFAATCFALKHTIAGDVLPLTESELIAYQTSAPKDVKR